MSRFDTETFTPAVLAAQREAYGRSAPTDPEAPPDRLGPDESAFIVLRDSFYMATVGKDGWPYLQHRGGEAGFLHVLDPSTLAFADLEGNRRLVSTGNLAGNDRVALLLMDYPHRARLKLLGRVQVLDQDDDPVLLRRLAPTAALRRRVRRIFRIEIVGVDWNCAAYITPRFTEAEVAEAVRPLHARIAELEAALAHR